MVSEQNVTETDPRDQFTYVCGRVHELDRCTDGASHVVRAHQFTNTGRVNAGYLFQVHDDQSFATTKKRGYLVTHVPVDRGTKGTVNVKDVTSSVTWPAHSGNCFHHLLDALRHGRVGSALGMRHERHGIY
jgi:hypothetical protein